jgi:hypothetical protein
MTMADHPIDIIIRARDQASKAIGNVNRSLSNMGSIAKRGAATTIRNLGRIGAAAGVAGAGLIALGIRNGVQSLADLETAVTSVNGAIQTMGLTGQVTGQQIATWANEIEAATDAAFDDKDITAATAGLIRFGKVGSTNLREAMVVMTDLAAQTGDVGSAGTTLARALANPTKATRLLTKVGVDLSDSQEKRIKQLYEAGKLEKAQALLLRITGKVLKDNAKDSVGPYGDALNTMNDATEDAQRVLGQGFLPVIQRAAAWITSIAQDPKAMAFVAELGEGLADAFDAGIDFAQKIPWSSVADGIKIAAEWAGKLFDAFNSLPPEVKSILIGLAGLNAISGGAIGGLAGEIGKLIGNGLKTIFAAHVTVVGKTVSGGGNSGPGGGNTNNTNNADTPDKNPTKPGTSQLPKPSVSGPGSSIIRSLPLIGLIDEMGEKIGVRKMGSLVREGVDSTTSAVDTVAQRQAESTIALSNVERSAASGLANTSRSAQMAGLLAAMSNAMAATRIVTAINGIHIPAPVISSTTVTYNNTQQNRNGRNSSRIKDGDDGGAGLWG